MATDSELVPNVIVPKRLNDYFEVITQAVFQTGVRWKQIAEHWAAYHAAFAEFDPNVVAAYGDLDVERVLAAPGILRIRRKVDATIRNAQALLAADEEFNGFGNYLRAFDSYAELAANLKKQLKFVGDMNVWYVLFRVGEPVPRFEAWVKTIPGEHPRMREMVEKGRAEGLSRET